MKTQAQKDAQVKRAESVLDAARKKVEKASTAVSKAQKGFTAAEAAQATAIANLAWVKSMPVSEAAPAPSPAGPPAPPQYIAPMQPSSEAFSL